MAIFDGLFGASAPTAEDELKAALEAEAQSNPNPEAGFLNAFPSVQNTGPIPIPRMKPMESRDSQATSLAREFMLKRESGGDYGASNQYGYQGGYQLGRDALVDIGFVRPDAPKGNAALNDPKNWTGKEKINSLEDFKASKEIQDFAFIEYANKNRGILEGKNVVRDDTSAADTAGHIGVAHGYGAGGAAKLALNGVDTNDGNNQSAANLFRNISGSNAAIPSVTVNPVRAAIALSNEGEPVPSQGALSTQNVSSSPSGALSSGGAGMDINRMIQELYSQPKPERREKLDSGVADAMIALGAGMIGGDFGGGAMAASQVLNNAQQRRIDMAREDEGNEFTRKQNLLNLAIAAQNSETGIMRAMREGAGNRSSTATDIAKAYNKNIVALPERIANLDGTLRSLDTLENIIDGGNVATGPIAGTAPAMMGQKLMWWDNPEDVENFEQLTSELSGAGRAMFAGSGAITDYEQRLIEKMKPSSKNSAAANKDIIARMRYGTQLSKEKATLYQSIHRNGWTQEGEDEFNRQWGERVRELEKEKPLSAFGGTSKGSAARTDKPANWDKY